jgi:hypothetical protein
MHDEVQIAIVQDSFRDITFIEVYPSKSIVGATEVISLNVFAHYTDMSIRLIPSSNVTIGGFDPEVFTAQLIHVEFNDFSGQHFSGDYTLQIHDGNSVPTSSVHFDQGIFTLNNATLPPQYKYYSIRNGSTNVYYTIGLTEIWEEAVYFGSIVPNQLVIAEFYNEIKMKIDEVVLVALPQV